MLRQKTTLLFIGLMCLSSVSHIFMVMCHDSERHVAVKFMVHNQCDRSETHEQDQFGWTEFGYCGSHNHCVDALLASNLFIGSQKDIKLLAHSVLIANTLLGLTPVQATSFSGYLTIKDHSFSPFFEPLRTLVLLA